MTKELIVLVGPPASGKSTYANELVTQGYTRISQDDQGKLEHWVGFLDAIEIHNESKIVIDRMNFNKQQRDRYLIPAREAGYKTRIIVFHVPQSVCMERCLVRENHPTIKNEKDASKAINFFFSKYERVEDSEVDVVERRGWDALTPAICFDIDGTLANIDNRLHFVSGKDTDSEETQRKDWKKFFANIPNDIVNEWCQKLNWSLQNAGFPIVVASGRPDDYKKETIEWLNQNKIQYNYLFMRRRGDFRKDDIVKEIIYEWEIKPRYNILMWIDDRQQVVDKIRSHGVTVLQCQKGDY